MSLIHWWTLNGDTKDYIGGKHGTLVNGGNVDGPGKFGKCYSSINNASNVSSSSDGISVPNCNLVDEVGNEYSFACWFLVHGTHGQYQSCIMSSGDWNQGNCWVIGFNNTNTEICCPVDNFNTGKISIGYQLTNNVWYHLATVYKDGITTAYLNGNVVGTVSRTGIYRSYSNHSYIGRDEGHGGFFPFNGDINDLRIYDHALSQAEVKELSKALAVHYTFNDTLSEPTINLLPSDLQNKYVENVADAAAYSITTGLTASSYTLSADIKRGLGDQSPSPYVSLFVTYSDGTSENITTTTAVDGYDIRGTADGQFHHYILTIFNTSKKTVTKVSGWILDRGSYTSGTPRYMTIQNAQLEAKDHATPYTPSSREGMLVNEAGYNYDISNCGFVLSKDSVKGSYSSYYKNGEQYSIAKNTTLNNEMVSTSVWFKSTNTSPKTDYHILMSIDVGVVEISIPKNGQLRWGGYTSNNSRVCNNMTVKSSSGSTFSLLDGKWHLINTVYDGSGWIAYVDGVYQTKWDATGTISYSNKNLIIGKYTEGATSNYGATDAYIDDVKIYNTILTSDDIKDLYQTKAYISDKGDIMCSEFIEGKTQAQVTSKGAFEAKEFYEEIGTPSGYDRLSYIQSTGTQYIDTGVSLGTSMVFDVMVSDVVDNAYVITQGNYGLRYLWGTFVNFVSGKRFRGTISTQAGVVNRVKGSNEYISIDGVQGAQESDNDNPSGNIIISKSGGCKIYECRLYNNDIPVRCYIPVKRQSDNVLGLYDTINNVFYTNAGTDTFIAGPVITNTNASIYSTHIISGRNLIEI